MNPEFVPDTLGGHLIYDDHVRPANPRLCELRIRERATAVAEEDLLYYIHVEGIQDVKRLRKEVIYRENIWRNVHEIVMEYLQDPQMSQIIINRAQQLPPPEHANPPQQPPPLPEEPFANNQGNEESNGESDPEEEEDSSEEGAPEEDPEEDPEEEDPVEPVEDPDEEEDPEEDPEEEEPAEPAGDHQDAELAEADPEIPKEELGEEGGMDKAFEEEEDDDDWDNGDEFDPYRDWVPPEEIVNEDDAPPPESEDDGGY